MRAVVVGPKAAWSTADVARGWINGLRQVGVQVGVFDLSQQLLWHALAEVDGETLTREQAVKACTITMLGECYKIDPDVIFVVHGADLDWELLKGLRAKVVLILTECPYENEGQALMCATVEPDLILLNDPQNAGVFDTIAPSFYLPHAYDPAFHHPGDGTHEFDCCFVGSGFVNRQRFMESVDWTDIDMALGGLWVNIQPWSRLAPFLVHEDKMECVDNRMTATLYRKSRTGFNIYRDDAHGEHSTADGWAIGPRELELAACGTWQARQSGRGESDELFGGILPTFDTPEELGDVIRWALAHPVEREKAADAARAVIEDRTFANHAGRALARLGF
jgi:hypothetical protein